MPFRFETYENAIYKHHLGSGMQWTQAAKWAFMSNLGQSDRTVICVKQTNRDTVEIITRKDQNLGIGYRWFGTTQQGLYERITINRAEQTTAIDRMDGNWWEEDAFIGRRDMFYPETREGSAEQMAFVRHDFWLWKPQVFLTRAWSNLSAFSYGRAIKSTSV